MSRASKVTLTVACGLSAGIVLFVHYKQWSDKEKLHDGVLRDTQRQQRRKIENFHFLQQQIKMGKILKEQEKEDDAVALQLLENFTKEE